MHAGKDSGDSRIEDCRNQAHGFARIEDCDTMRMVESHHVTRIRDSEPMRDANGDNMSHN